MTTPPSPALIDALAPLFSEPAAMTRHQIAAIAVALDDHAAKPLLSACCRAVALRSLITAASQTNNAEAARRAAMTLLDQFTTTTSNAPPLDHPDAIAHTRKLLEQDEPAE